MIFFLGGYITEFLADFTNWKNWVEDIIAFQLCANMLTCKLHVYTD